MDARDTAGMRKFRLRNPLNPQILREDLALLFQKNREGQYILNGRLNRISALLACYRKAIDHVEMVGHYADGSLMCISRGHNLKTTAGVDLQTHMTNGDVSVGCTGTAGAVSATTITLTGQGAPGSTTFFNGHLVQMGGVYGVILSCTNAAPPVATIDKWYTPATPGGAAAATPTAGEYLVTPGVMPAMWIALTTDATAPAIGDTTLASEANVNGVTRSFATFAHTNGTNTATLSFTFTATGSVGVLAKGGNFNAANGGTMFCETLLNATANLQSNGDNVAVTWTFTHS